MPDSQQYSLSLYRINKEEDIVARVTSIENQNLKKSTLRWKIKDISIIFDETKFEYRSYLKFTLQSL